MLASNMVESRSGHVKLSDVELPVFNAMLTYIYSGRVDDEFLASKCEELLALADKVPRYVVALWQLTRILQYDIGKLKEKCELLLAKAMSLETVVNLLSVAETYHAANLKSMALLFAGQCVHIIAFVLLASGLHSLDISSS